MTIHRNNAGEVEPLVRMLESIGVNEMQCVPISNSGRASSATNLWLTVDQNLKVGDSLVELRNETSGRMELFAVDGLMNKPCTSCVKRGEVYPVMAGCGAGRQGCCIDPDGNVVPCLLVREPVAGNVRERPFHEIWVNSEIFKNWRRIRESDPACHEQVLSHNTTFYLRFHLFYWNPFTMPRFPSNRTDHHTTPGDAPPPRVKNASPFLRVRIPFSFCLCSKQTH